MSTRTPTVADVAAIVAIEDDVLRNLRITDCYHALALAVRAHTGVGANWCAFATWASRQAGRTIRRADLREALRDRLVASAEVAPMLRLAAATLAELRVGRDARSVVDALIRALEEEAAFHRASKAVAVGNRKVFEEIAYEFARFLAMLDSATGLTESALAEFTAELRPGDPPGGQSLLSEAFTAYAGALEAEEEKERAELLFLGNLRVGLHEQTRLQPEIAAAMNAAFDAAAVRQRLIARLLPGAWLRLRYRVASLFGRRPPLDEAIDALLAETQRELRRLLTATAMTLHLPGDRVLRLGADLRAGFPAALESLSNEDLLALLARIDPTPDSPLASGARDWADLPQRMHLITDLFRCYHAWEPLFEPPYTPAQLAALRESRVPAGPL